VLDAGTRDELERLLAGTLLGVIELRPGLRHWTSKRLEMCLVGEMVWVGIDGELIALEVPLRFSVDPAALRVLVSEELRASRQVLPLETGLQAARTLRR